MEHPKAHEHRSGFDTFSGTRHSILAALARNREHVGCTSDVGRVLGFLWSDCTGEMPLAREVVDRCQLAPTEVETRLRQVAHLQGVQRTVVEPRGALSHELPSFHAPQVSD